LLTTENPIVAPDYNRRDSHAWSYHRALMDLPTASGLNRSLLDRW
jgi:hypothetical protein